MESDARDFDSCLRISELMREIHRFQQSISDRKTEKHTIPKCMRRSCSSSGLCYESDFIEEEDGLTRTDSKMTLSELSLSIEESISVLNFDRWSQAPGVSATKSNESEANMPEKKILSSSTDYKVKKEIDIEDEVSTEANGDEVIAEQRSCLDIVAVESFNASYQARFHVQQAIVNAESVKHENERLCSDREAMNKSLLFKFLKRESFSDAWWKCITPRERAGIARIDR